MGGGRRREDFGRGGEKREKPQTQTPAQIETAFQNTIFHPMQQKYKLSYVKKAQDMVDTLVQKP